MTDFNTFKELADDTKEKMKSYHNYPAKTLSRYDGIVKIIGHIMNQNNCVYSANIIDQWLKECAIKFSKSTVERYRRVASLLTDNYHGNLDGWKIYSSQPCLIPKSNEYLNVINDYKIFMEHEEYSTKTVLCRLHDARYFLLYLEDNNVFNTKDISNQMISNYILSEHFENRKIAGISAEIIGLRKFIIYLEDRNLTSCSNIHFACITKKNDTRRIVTTCNDAQVSILLEPYHDFPSNLRNKAIYLLALRCGLRMCDIFNLKFENIDMKNKTIHIIQKKTNVALSLPFDNEVSNAIIDYLLNERRKCNCQYVFITSIGQVRRLTHNTSIRTFRRFRSLKKEDQPRQFGIHILRRTFASSLLTAGADVSLISAALGHINNATVDKYLSTDKQKMKRCALPIDQIPYEGGLF